MIAYERKHLIVLQEKNVGLIAYYHYLVLLRFIDGDYFISNFYCISNK